MTRRRRWIPMVAAVLALGLLTSCSGVPSSSSPEVIRTISGGVAPSPASSISPGPGLDPRQIVSGFLAANVSEDAHHTGARSYLSGEAAKNWVDTTTSVVNAYEVGLPDRLTRAVTVTADKLGTVDARGIYTPVTQGSGTTPISLTFGVTLIGDQWRINAVSNGLLVDRDHFQQTYKSRPLYFFDQGQKRLVSDLRYTALSGTSLYNWLLVQLIAGPRAELQSAYTSDFPEPSARVAVTLGSAGAVVDLPGTGQLDAASKARLAVQLSFTFHTDFAPLTIALMDGAKPVAIPNVATPFSLTSFPSYTANTGPPPVYYVRSGAVVDENGLAVGGTTRDAVVDIDSIAVAARTGGLLLAATKGKVALAQLAVGPLSGPLTSTDVPAGPLTRPAWAPGLSEVWVGDGQRLFRIPSLGGPALPVSLASSSGSVNGQISSVAISPDGVRIALIIVAADLTSQLWIGSIVRAAGGASIQSLEPITPVDLHLSDVAWNDVSTLYTIGVDSTRPGTYGIWSVQMDGSLLTSRTLTNLPGAPDSITASQYALPWVSAKTAVWVQRGPENAWTAPSGPGGTAYGTYPTYVQ